MKGRLATLVRTFRNEVAVYRSVVVDRRCPRMTRWLLGGAVAYALSPIDLIPDFIPVIGHLDDAIILPLLIWLALRAIPKELVDEHRMTFT
ncbi:YkvA family protein [Verrucomicrobiota bacterium]